MAVCSRSGFGCLPRFAGPAASPILDHIFAAWAQIAEKLLKTALAVRIFMRRVVNDQVERPIAELAVHDLSQRWRVVLHDAAI
jgi:hypothetical protein